MVANPQDKGGRVDGRGVRVKMDENVSKEHKTDKRQKISQRRETVTLQKWVTDKQEKGSKKRRDWIQRGGKHWC